MKWKICKSVHCWPISRPPIFQSGPQNGTLNTWIGNFFHKTDPLLILILCRKLFINFKIGQFWADWQTPQYVQNGPKYGAQNTRVGIFFIILAPFQFGFCTRNCWKFFKIGPFLADWQTPYVSKWPAIWGPKYIAGGPEICQTNFTST